ncbi:hypothetical protein [Parabacteroides goldsteinii]|jgi:hypothetical protein|uniref:hypothetical protein n=1 Tax=Parabacteroides goldsteinii TaxID=328812 RepID=UPI00205CF0A2|nr:hypothetical protein [Parabacteroides goldsteinii]DAT74227.1 MAG TPA: hypothetical protein [Caudoviricetes sp.]
MKILADFGQEIEIKYKQTFYDQTQGWPTVKKVPEIYINGALKFTGTEVDCTGCSLARAIGHKVMARECFDWIVENCINYFGNSISPCKEGPVGPTAGPGLCGY